MSIESIVVSLKNAKRLKKAGFPQDDVLFYWHQQMDSEWELLTRMELDQALMLRRVHVYYAAPTAEEILWWLPKEIANQDAVKKGFSDAVFCIDIYCCGKDGWCIEYRDLATVGAVLIDLADPSLVNAAADIYIYLSEQNLPPKP